MGGGGGADPDLLGIHKASESLNQTMCGSHRNTQSLNEIRELMIAGYAF